MSAADPASLKNLHDIVEPAAVSMWPPAPGAWLLAGIALTWIAAGFLLWLIRRRRDAYRHEALRVLDVLEEEWSGQGQAATVLPRLAELLKRVALTGFDRSRVASLAGAEWLAFLDRTGGDGAFASGPASLLASLPYSPRAAAELSAEERAAILAAARRWIRGHRLEAES